MRKQSQKATSNFLARFASYISILAKVLHIAAGAYPYKIIAAMACATFSTIMTAVAFMVAVDSVSQLQSKGVITVFPVLDRIGLSINNPSLTILLGVILALFLISAVLAYYSRKIPIDMENLIYCRITDGLLSKLRTNANLFSMVSADISLDKEEITKVIISDARLYGTAVRLILFNSYHILSLSLGIVIILIFLPGLFFILFIAVVISMFALYPINMKAVQMARELHAVAPLRTAQLRQHITEALDSRTHVIMPDDPPETIQTDDIVRQFLQICAGRLLVLESGKIVMQVIFAIGITALLWMLLRGVGDEILNYANLLVLLFGFRFAFSGLQGIAVTLTAINRFLPQIIKTQKVLRKVDRFHVSTQGPAKPIKGLRLGTLKWQLSGDGKPGQSSGELKSDAIYGIMARGSSHTIGLVQFLKLFGRNRLDFAAACDRFLSDVAAVRNTSPPSSAGPETSSWIASVMTEGALSISSEKVAAKLKIPVDTVDTHSIVAHALYDLIIMRELHCPFVLFDIDPILKMNPPGVLAAIQPFAGKLIIFTTTKVNVALAWNPASHLFVSNSQEIVTCVAISDLDDELRESIRNIALGERSGDTAVQDDAFDPELM